PSGYFLLGVAEGADRRKVDIINNAVIIKVDHSIDDILQGLIGSVYFFQGKILKRPDDQPPDERGAQNRQAQGIYHVLDMHRDTLQKDIQQIHDQGFNSKDNQ